ncbi:hypothetical protein IT575_00730 [bacterium]|nr:hypothetical protein [bacterium]
MQEAPWNPEMSAGGMAGWMRTEQLAQARRWVKYPATILFALCVLWLVRCYMLESTDWSTIKNQIESLGGTIFVLFAYFGLPLGSAIAGIGLLTLHRWAYPLAALLPLYPMIEMTGAKITRIGAKFHEFHQSASQAGGPNTTKLGDGLIDCLLLLGAWAAIVLMGYYLWRSWQYLAPAKSRRHAAAATAGAQSAAAAGNPAMPGNGTAPLVEDDGDVCFLLPEVREEGSARR